jgi:DHA1 family multidrug resistance protein-like MFS transporter
VHPRRLSLLFEEEEPITPWSGFAAPAPVLVACALSFVLYLGAYMRLPLVPLFASDLGATTIQVGMINAGFMVAAALLSLPLGLVSDRLGRRRLILAGMTISGLTSLFLLLVRTPLQVGTIYLFSGIGLACFSPSMMSYVGDVSPPSFLGRAYGWYTSSLYLGMAAGPGLGGAIAAGGFRAAFLVSAAVIAAGILVGGPRMPAPPAVIRPATANLATDFREIVRNRAVLACWTATFFSTYAWGSLFAFFPLYAREMGISVTHTGLIFTCQAAANAAVRIPIGHLTDRTGKRERYIISGNLLFALFIALIGMFPNAFPLYLLFLGIGGTMAAAFTAIGAVLSESVPTRVRGLAMGGYNTCIYGGFAVSAATLGAVISRFGFAAGFAAAGGLCALSVGAFVLLFPPSPGPAFHGVRREEGP